VVRLQTGTKVIAHLNHPGRMANPNIPGNYFVSSTDRPCENGGAAPKRMDKKDIRIIVGTVVLFILLLILFYSC